YFKAAFSLAFAGRLYIRRWQSTPRKKALIRGTFLAAIGFEVIKIVMTYTLPSLMKSPSGAAFGSVLGLMAFFYFFARLTLFCAAWIATAEYKDDPRMPGKTQP
ncbi:YhjD/YihY/BrkB family envelope integrity protein, partial [Escherichia sp. R-CC3]